VNRIPVPIRLTADAAALAGEQWCFNCGPAALCAVFGLTPEEVRPYLGNFEKKGYTNPTLMLGALLSLGARWDLLPDRGGIGPDWPSWGLVRVQWGGPWTKPGVPIAARYRQTHWVASCRTADSHGIFDVNALSNGTGWVSLENWKTVLVPWILKELVPRADGTWWLTHSIEVVR